MIQAICVYTVSCDKCGHWCESSTNYMKETPEEALDYARDEEGWRIEVCKKHLCLDCREDA